MKEQQLQDAIGELSEELLAPVAALREKKRIPWMRWVALAACLCLVVGLTLSWDGFRASSKMDHALNDFVENAPEVPMEDMMDASCAYGGSLTADSATAPAFLAKVIQLGSGSILVEPLEGEAELRCADRIWVDLPEQNTALAPEVGENVKITYSGQIEETYPAHIRDTVSVERIG